MHKSREKRCAFRRLLDRFVMWLNGTQCASLHPHKNGGYIYCTKKAGHFGRHESYAGDKLTNTPVCHDCHKPINSDDEANICIECGGRNSRIAT